MQLIILLDDQNQHNMPISLTLLKAWNLLNNLKAIHAATESDCDGECFVSGGWFRHFKVKVNLHNIKS